MIGFEVIFWYWWVLAVLLLAIEIIAPGFFFLWMSIAGVITGGVLFLIPGTSLEMQLLVFSLLSFLSILVWRRYVGKLPDKTDHPLLNKRGAQYIGRTFTLIEAIENGQGKIKVDDSIWKVQGTDCPIGSKVKVVAVDGVIFKVENVV
jgi:inner membrane protein